MSLWEFVVTPRYLLVLLYYLLVYKLGDQLYKDLMNVNELWDWFPWAPWAFVLWASPLNLQVYADRPYLIRWDFLIKDDLMIWDASGQEQYTQLPAL